jgi:general secretion pathway protein D
MTQSGCSGPGCTGAAASQPSHAPTKEELAQSKNDLAQAKKAYANGESLEKHGKREDALAEYKRANSLAPGNPRYALAMGRLTQELVFEHVKRGNSLMDEQRTVDAAAEFKAALALDATDDFARQRLRDAAPPARSIVSYAPDPEDDGEPQLKPKPGKIDLHLRGMTTTVLTSLAQAYGLQAEVDSTIGNKNIELNLTSVDFVTAASVASVMTHTFYVARGDKQILFAPDTPQKHIELDRMLLRSFDMTDFATPADMTDVVNMLKTVFEIKSVSLAPNSSVLTLKAPAPIMGQVEDFFATLDSRRPQVLLDIKAFAINHQMMETLGIAIPNQFNVFNLTAADLALQNTNVQSLINQLISSGAINQANSSALSTLLAQLVGQSTASAIFANPLATFGGGLTLFGVGIPPTTATASLNDSRIQTLQNMSLRTSQGNAATFQVGERYPVINGTYAPIYNSAAISQVIGSQTYVAPIPSISYVDLGLTLKATPLVHGDSNVTLKLELSIKALGTTSYNGVPVISNDEYSATIGVKNGEQAALVGYVTSSDSRSYSGFPGIGQVPVLNLLTGQKTKQIMDGELVIVITPYIISPGRPNSSPLFTAPL